VGPAPKCRRSAFWEGPQEVCAALSAGGSQLVAGGTKTRRGAKAKQKTECRRGGERPRSGDRAKGGVTQRQTRSRPKFICTRLREFATKAVGFEHADPPRGGRSPTAALEVWSRQIVCSTKHGNRWEEQTD